MATPAPDYVVTIKDLSGVEVVADLPVSELVLSKTLNAPGSASFAVPTSHEACSATDLEVGARRVEIARDGDLVWGGDLWMVGIDTSEQMARFMCAGYYERLRHRTFAQNLFYSHVEQFDIAWGLIHYTQTLDYGALGIKREPTSDSGVKRNRHFCAWESGSIADAIDDLATADDGFDYEITPDLWWKTWYPRRGVTDPVTTFTFGDTPDDATNVYELRFEEDAGSLANLLAGIPDDECLDLSDFIIVQNAASLGEYGLMQESVSLPNIHHRDDQKAYLKEELRIRKTPRKQLTITTPDAPWDSPAPWRMGYEVGDLVNVTADLGYVTYSEEHFRLQSWEVRVEQGQEMASVMLDSVTT